MRLLGPLTTRHNPSWLSEMETPKDLEAPPTARMSSSPQLVWTETPASTIGRSTGESSFTSSISDLDDNSGPHQSKPQRLDNDEKNTFSVTAKMLDTLLERRSLDELQILGGIRGLERALLTNRYSGISIDHDGAKINSAQDNERLQMFGRNNIPEKKTKTLFTLLWLTLNDKVLLLLTAVAAISLVLGLYQTFGQPHKPGEPRIEWVEGVTILTAVAVVVVVGALNDYQKERQFTRLNSKKVNRMVKVIRFGKSCEISIYDVMVGDILHVEPGDVLPADGVLVSGYNVCCDESIITGESKPKRKTPGDRIPEAYRDDLDPFLISGTKVLEGIGTYLATSVGEHSIHGRLMFSLTDEDTEPTVLQVKLTAVANQIASAGVAVAVFLFLALSIKFLWELKWSFNSPSSSGQYIHTLLRITIISISVVVVAVPEGLPLAVTLALAFAATRMLKDMNLVRVLGACETMGNVTNICCDKTGTLTTNRMTVVAGIVGTKHQFGAEMLVKRDIDDLLLDMPAPTIVSPSKFASILSEEVRYALSQSIVINSTAFEGDENGTRTFIGSRTEGALLSFAQERLGLKSVAVERANAPTALQVPFDSTRKYMISVVDLGGIFRMYIKGAPDVLLAKSNRIVTDATISLDQTTSVNSHVHSLNQTMENYSSHSLRMIAVAYRDFPSCPTAQPGPMSPNVTQGSLTPYLEDLTFLGIFGVQDPLRPGARDAITLCQRAGVTVRMITGDNVGTAIAVAKECGILRRGGVVLEGPAFRALSRIEMLRVIPDLQVLARSSPEDKRILVKMLRQLGEVVAVTGDGTNDGPALRTADVGLSMGISGSEIAREASSIILMDDDFASIVKAIKWGRTVNDSVRKFLQFQLTVNITAVTLTCVSAIASAKEESILTPVQLLWVNLIMDTFAALALATDPPAPSVLDRGPQARTAPLITVDMWKMITAQAVYQLLVILTMHFMGDRIISNIGSEDSLETLVFNTYVWMQLFNQCNNRRLDSKLNVLEGIHRNWYFIGINLITILGQLLIMFFGGNALSTVPLSPTQWGISIMLGAFSLVVGVVVRLTPNEIVRTAWGRLRIYGNRRVSISLLDSP